MKHSTKIIWGILAGCILVGALLAGIGVALGAKRQVYVDRSGVHAVNNGNRGELVHVSENLEPLTSLHIDAATADVQLIAGDAYALEIDYPKDGGQISWEQKDGALRVIQESADNQGIFFHVDFSFIGNEHPWGTIRITYPQDSELADLAAHTSSGDITLGDLRAANMEISCADGSIEIEQVSTGKLRAKTSSGDLALHGVQTEDLYADVRSGSLTLGEVTTRSGEIQMVDGSISVSGCALGESTVSNSSGDLLFDDVQADRLSASTKSGVITLAAVRAGQGQFTNRDGSILITDSEITTLAMDTGSGDISGFGLKVTDCTAQTKSGALTLADLTAGTVAAENADGSIILRNGDIEFVKAKTLSGDIRFEEMQTGGGELDVSSGDISLQGALRGENQISSKDGAIQIATSLERADYSYEAETRSGAVVMDGQEYGAHLTERSAGTANSISASTLSGDIRLIFAA